MRKNGIVAVVVLTFVLGLSAIGQQVDLAVEPVRLTTTTNSLADAVRRNDFPTFDSMYRNAVRRGEMVQEFADLHRLWTWSMNDPTGAFYGVEQRALFARAYPGFAPFIDRFEIIDANGNAFYPAAETRAFLLQQAEIGVIARLDTAPALEPAAREIPQPVQLARVTPPAIQNVAPAPKPASPPAVVAARVQPAAPATVLAVPEPAVAIAELREPVTSSPHPAPVVTRAADAVEVPRTVPAQLPSKPSPDRSALGRGIFLIIAGLLGIGTVSMMLHTPATRS